MGGAKQPRPLSTRQPRKEIAVIVCDECRDVNKKAHEVALVVEKVDDPGRRGRKPRPREVIKIPLVLCEQCLTAVCKNLGYLKVYGNLSGKRLPPETAKLPAAKGTAEEGGAP